MADTWRNTLEAIRRLTRRGIIINAWKLQLLMQWVSILGYELVQDVFQLGRKSLGKLFGSELPTNREFLQLLGCLNFAGPFVADYKQRVRPLYALTKCSSNKHWTADHTALLNKLAAAVAQWLALGLVNVGQPATLYVGVNESDMSAVMT